MAAKTIPIMTGIATSGADDDLLAALLRQLPVSGPFPGRATWDKMWKLALDLKYGPTEDVPAFLPPGAMQREAAAHFEANNAFLRKIATDPAPAAPKPKHAGHTIYIGPDGEARYADGAPVLLGDVPPDETIFDYRLPVDGFRDKDSIVWADGTRGTAGMAPGVSFCGPG